ncbi:hypothetical protein SK066_02220 [Paenibacillus hunanensis]|uniref:hypothetical protein n=1 Tax=Paenibacillus hunanensis TaxID=539262 RepID=UPI002A69E05D|nr:hypothetical protein [Paenibacillus hunanensis]WPP41801.1 hypothetical protein SK066_02220 [Paenibacillus hunanensis]
MKKISFSVFCFILLLSTYSSLATAADETLSNESNKQYTVKDIVSPEYLEKYKGKYSSYEEVQEAAGFENSLAPIEENQKEEFESRPFLKINSVDEYAAYLFYAKDQNNQNEINYVSEDDIKPKYSAMENWSTIIHDGGIPYKIVGYADVLVNKCTITNVSAYSKIVGFVPLTQWLPDTPSISRPNNYTATIRYSGTQVTGVNVGGNEMVQRTPVAKTYTNYAICHVN